MNRSDTRRSRDGRTVPRMAVVRAILANCDSGHGVIALGENGIRIADTVADPVEGI